jgi:hypothetical protein
LPPKDFQFQTRVNGNSRSPHCYAAMSMERLRYLAGMMCMVQAREEHARRMQMESEHKVMQVTWNDDGTMTLVVEGHVEPVRAGDTITYSPRNRCGNCAKASHGGSNVHVWCGLRESRELAMGCCESWSNYSETANS